MEAAEQQLAVGMHNHQHQQKQQQQQQQEQQQQWTPQQQHFMKLAFEQAKVALRLREVPIGCVVVRDGKVIGTGYNMTNHTRNATRHAELEAIDRLLADHDGDVAKVDFGRCQLYVTIEPCVMCAGALSLMGFEQVYFGASNDKFGGCGSILQVHQSACGNCGGSGDTGRHGVSFQAFGGLYAEEAIQMLQQFYLCGNPQAPKPKRTVLEVTPWQLQQQQEQLAPSSQLERQPEPHQAPQQLQQQQQQEPQTQEQCPQQRWSQPLDRQYEAAAQATLLQETSQQGHPQVVQA